LKEVTIYTDGACSGNPGPGGWRAILKYGNREKHLTGGEKLTTNNRMELTAVIKALNRLKESCNVSLYSDSRYVVKAINEKWLWGWKKNGWKKSDKTPVLNVDLWQELLPLLQIHNVKFFWVKGHNNHPENELRDKLAVAEREKFAK
jgi:ribonuclease HI